MASIIMEETQARQEDELSRQELLEQLEKIVTSSHFRNSKRYPAFLRFIVERTVEGNTEVLKERNLGIDVFGRPIDYDTSADPIVRVTAGEVRKRIAQYYQVAGHEHELRIDLPLGSYVPHFYPANHSHGSDTASAERVSLSADGGAVTAPLVASEVEVVPGKVVERPAGRLGFIAKKLLIVGLCVGAAVAVTWGWMSGLAVFRTRQQNQGINYIWQSSTPSSSTLIVIGVHFGDAVRKALAADVGASYGNKERESVLASMEITDMVPVSDIVSYSKITDLLSRRSIAYSTRGSNDSTLDELRAGPVVLVGGFDNVWTMRLSSNLRYRFVSKTLNVKGIQDSESPSTVWTFDYLQPAIINSTDYAIVASYFDKTIEQHVVIAAGIGKNGTVAAAEFLTSDKDLKKWLTEAKIPANKNVELVLSTDVLDGEPGPPHIIASSVW